MNRTTTLFTLLFLWSWIHPARSQVETSTYQWIQLAEGESPLHVSIYPSEQDQDAIPVLLLEAGRQQSGPIKSMVDRLNQAGFTVIIPDIWNIKATLAARENLEAMKAAYGTGHKKATDSFIYKMDLVKEYVSEHMRFGGRISVIGIESGGQKAFELGMKRSYLDALITISASAPRSPGAIARLTAPSYAFYGEFDPAIAKLSETQRYMKASRKVFRPVIFPGAQASYIRDLDRPEKAQNHKAASATLSGIIAILAGLYPDR